MISSNRVLIQKLRLRAALTAMLVLGGCQEGSIPIDPTAPDASDVEHPPATLVVGPLHQLLPAAPVGAFAFRADTNGFAAGYLTHRVTVSEGIVDVTPKHLDEVSGQVVTGGAIGLATTGVFADVVRLDTGAGDHEPHGPTAVRIARGDVVEEITNRPDGVEQSWHFATKPPAGDLTVEVSVAGQELVATTTSGLHFQSPAGLGFRYSHAVWRDANGAELEVPVRFEGRILITVPDAVVQASTYPAVLDPTITAELYADVPTTATPGANTRNQDVAATATGYFAVWQDQRNGRDDDIYATAVDLTGTPISPTSVLINGDAGVQQHPVVASVPLGQVFAWETLVAGGDTNIAAAYLPVTGTLVQLGTIAGTSSLEFGAAIAGRGAQALLVWCAGTHLRGAIFNGLVFGAPFDIVATGTAKEPAVSADPLGNYLVTYTDTVSPGTDIIRGQLVTPAGTLVGSPVTISGGLGLRAQSAVAFNGTNHVVAWTWRSDLYAARVSPAGAVLDTTPVTISATTRSQILPDVACTGPTCLIAWQDSRNATTSVRDIYGALVSPSLSIILNNIPIATRPRAQSTPAVAAQGTGYFATWADNYDLDYTFVRGSTITSVGTVVTPGGEYLARALTTFHAPSIAQSTTHTDVFMPGSDSSDVNLFHIRFTGAGEHVGDANGNPQVVSDAAGAQLDPSAAYVGTHSMVAWSDSRNTERDIYAARVDVESGSVIDSSGIPVCTVTGDQHAPRIASAGHTALIVWQDRRSGKGGGFDIYGAIIDENGAITANNIPICTAPGDQSGPAVAYDPVDNVYLVVWTHPNDSTTHIRGARVSATGTVLDANCGIAISNASNSQFRARATYGSGHFLVVWEDRRNDPARGDIYGARINVNGVLSVLDPAGLPIAVVPNSQQSFPSVAFESTYAGWYLIAWTDDRTQATTGTDIYGAQLSAATGAVTTTFPISATTENELSVDVSAGTGQNPFNVAYLRHDSTFNTTVLQFRHVDLGTADGQPCSTGTTCESGFCSDGVCCDTACGGGVTTDCQACSTARGGTADGTCTVIPAHPSFLCRNYAVLTDTPQCDVREYCDGASPLCPPDLGQNAGAACVGVGVVGTCPPATAAGAPHYCR